MLVYLLWLLVGAGQLDGHPESVGQRLGQAGVPGEPHHHPVPMHPGEDEERRDRAAPASTCSQPA